ncbi:hypothetical protein NZJ93_12635 [Desulfofundulus thermocisternus]|nr:hypothetical protein [Desulfofundulus thermocisternus]
MRLTKEGCNIRKTFFIACAVCLFLFLGGIGATADQAYSNQSKDISLESTLQSDKTVPESTAQENQIPLGNFGEVKPISPSRVADNASQMIYNLANDIGKVVPPLVLFMIVISVVCLILGTVSKTIRKFALLGILFALFGLTVYYMAPGIIVMVNNIANNLQK